MNSDTSDRSILDICVITLKSYSHLLSKVSPKLVEYFESFIVDALDIYKPGHQEEMIERSLSSSNALFASCSPSALTLPLFVCFFHHQE